MVYVAGCPNELDSEHITSFNRGHFEEDNASDSSFPHWQGELKQTFIVALYSQELWHSDSFELCMKKREREAASRHCFWTCSRSKWRGGELPDWINFFSWKDPSAEPWMVGSWTLWIFGQCQKSQQVTQGCALQWNCIKIYGEKCETNCLFLVAHILIEMVEERSWRNIAASQAVDVYIIYAPLVWEDYLQQFVKISPSASCM